MSENCCKTGLPGAALFGIAFGAGVLGGAALAIVLLELRESILRSATTRRRGIPDYMYDVASDFTMLTEDIVGGIESAKRADGSELRTFQDMKTHIRRGGSLDERAETKETKALFNEISPSEG